MSPADVPDRETDAIQDHAPIQCDACESALHSRSDQQVAFLLLDQITLPLMGCDDHREEFASVCGFTTGGTAEIIYHRPAGGITCPSCHLAPYSPGHPVIPVQDGAVAVLACPEHRTEILDRFHSGLETRRQLTAPLDTERM